MTTVAAGAAPAMSKTRITAALTIRTWRMLLHLRFRSFRGGKAGCRACISVRVEVHRHRLLEAALQVHHVPAALDRVLHFDEPFRRLAGCFTELQLHIGRVLRRGKLSVRV